MSTPNNRRRDPGRLPAETILLWIAITAVSAIAGMVYTAMRLGHRLAGTGAELPTNPFDMLFNLLRGDLEWPGSAGWWVLAAIAALLLALGVLGFLGWRRFQRRRSRVDHAAAHLGRGRDVEDLSRKSTSAKALRLGVAGAPGVPIGRTVSTGQQLYGSWEDMHVDIWGPRTGKTTSRAVPAILDAPGPVLATSNKRDIVDATRDVRAKTGPVWVFDPQAIALEDPTWWWNPLSYVTDEVKAAKLAEHFAAGGREPGARTDAYFDSAGQDLLAGLLLAAALDNRAITDVYVWLTRPTDETAVDVLREHGFALTADQVAGVVSAPEEQRGGVFGTAMQMASCLTNRQVARWVTPQGATDPRHQFDPASFVRGSDTLYSLSREGKGTAGPLVTALTVAVVEAAEELASRSAGGRLVTPLLGVLDEAANVCRWRELPNLYSHYGSRGIVLMTFLQSWSQGVGVWGNEGMRTLWSAANIKVYGGGVSESGFLEDLSRQVGDYDRLSSSASYSRGQQRTVSQQLHRERILDIADLASLPKGRAVVLASGSRPTLIRTQPWMTGPHAEAVKASLAAHDLAGGATDEVEEAS